MKANRGRGRRRRSRLHRSMTGPRLMHGLWLCNPYLSQTEWLHSAPANSTLLRVALKRFLQTSSSDYWCDWLTNSDTAGHVPSSSAQGHQEIGKGVNYIRVLLQQKKSRTNWPSFSFSSSSRLLVGCLLFVSNSLENLYLCCLIPHGTHKMYNCPPSAHLSENWSAQGGLAPHAFGSFFFFWE